MERSKLENIGNTQLFFLLKKVKDEYYYNKIGYDEIEDSSFLESCDTAGRIVGITDLDFLDYNYINASLILNQDFNFDSSKPDGTLLKPKPSYYSFDIDEFRTEQVRRTYTHESTSYLPELLKPMIDKMETEGVFDYYDGGESDVDYYDGETTDVKFDKSSIRQIK
jgi:hypothetical protein